MANRFIKGGAKANHAVVNFRPAKIDLARIPDNEKFGEKVIAVRLAAVTLNKTKAELVEMIRTAEKDSMAADRLHDIVTLLTNVSASLKAAAKLCDTASTRLYIAASASDISQGVRKPKRRKAA